METHIHDFYAQFVLEYPAATFPKADFSVKLKQFYTRDANQGERFVHHVLDQCAYFLLAVVS